MSLSLRWPFRALGKGNNYLVCLLTVLPYLKQASNLEVKVCDPAGIAPQK
jgi:hypothetical protein